MGTTQTDDELIAAIRHLEESGYKFFEVNGANHMPVMFMYSGCMMPGDLDCRVSLLLHERAKRIPRGRFSQLTFREE